MTVPGSGQISLGKLGQEKRATGTGNNYDNGPHTAAATNLAVVHLNSNSGGYGSIGVNSASPSYPDDDQPFAITEWYGYNHLATSSDIRLKENIIYIGVSQNRIPIYVFSYIGCAIRYIGTMAQDLLRIGRSDAVTVMDNGYYGVYYDKLDIDNKIV